jgi:hypothetical protein
VSDLKGDRHWLLVDPSALVALSNGWNAGRCIAADGSETFWLVAPHETATSESTDCRAVLHEQTGKLPAEYLRRLGYQCHAITSRGTRCTRVTSVIGNDCATHAESGCE